MMYLSNILNISTSNNTIFYIIIVILILMSLLMFSLKYKENKSIKDSLKLKQTEANSNEPFNIYQSTQELKSESNSEKVVSVEPLISDIKEQLEPEKTGIPTISEEKSYINNSAKELANVSNNNINSFTEEEPELIELSDIPIPNKLEYTQALWQNDFLELQSLTKELETLPKEHKIKMTPFEEEQEEKAIISYDELINRNDTLDFTSEPNNSQLDNSLIKNQINMNNKEEFVRNTISPIQTNQLNYTHEESFLKDLKELKDSLI